MIFINPGKIILQSVNRRHVFSIAWPIILSNLSTPLLGLVDTAVIGNLGNAALIGAIAVGGIIFSFLYWGFGFLRMGTTGLVAQARGAGDKLEVKAAFYRSFIVGLSLGTSILILQYPISIAAMFLVEASTQVESAALTYFNIRIWGAPFSLAHLAVMGYLLGQQDSRSLLLLQLVLNGTNIILDLIFVVGFGWGVAGVAAATVIAEIIVISLGITIVIERIKSENSSISIPTATLFDIVALKRMFVVNRDIMIRTLCLLFAFAWFTNQGAQAGDIILSANAILMQFITFAAFFLDGFALAAESLVGNAIGGKKIKNLNLAIRYTTEQGILTAVLLSICLAIAGSSVIHLLTNVDDVRRTAEEYLIWVIAAPVLSVWCYLLDGIFIGATRTIQMRNAMIISLSIFLFAWYLLHERFGNHGLWAALQIYFLARAVSLGYYFPGIKKLAY